LAGLAALSSGDTRLDTLIRLTCARALSLPPLPSEVDLIDGASDHEAAVAAFAEQFAVDVSGIGAHQREQLYRAEGCRRRWSPGCWHRFVNRFVNETPRNHRDRVK
jgi:hypothetical protein